MLGSFRFTIFDFFRGETGGRSGGRPAIFPPLAVFVGGEADIGGGISSEIKDENFLTLFDAISLASENHVVYPLCSSVLIHRGFRAPRHTHTA